MTNEFLEGAVRVGVESLDTSGIIAGAEEKERMVAWERASLRFERLFALTAFVIVACGVTLCAFASFNIGSRIAPFEVRDNLLGATMIAMGVIVYLLFAAYKSTVATFARPK